MLPICTLIVVAVNCWILDPNTGSLIEEFKRVIFFCFLLKLEIAQKHPDIYAVPVKTQKAEQNWPQPMRYGVSSSKHSVSILDFAGRRKTDLASFCSYKSSCLGISFSCSASKIIIKWGRILANSSVNSFQDFFNLVYLQ